MAPPLNLATAFLAGLVSFVSPCVLPLVPSYLSFLTGSTVEELKTHETLEERARVLAHALVFCAGFTTVFVALGFSAGAIGGLLVAFKSLLARLGGAVIIVLGLHMTGLLRITWLAMDRRIHLRKARQSFGLSFTVGLAFAAGWSPCIGPILSAIYLLAAEQHGLGAAVLLLAYSLGLALPFLVTAAALSRTLGVLTRLKRALPTIEAASGALLIATGLVLVTGTFTRVAGFFYHFVQPPSL